MTSPSEFNSAEPAPAQGWRERVQASLVARMPPGSRRRAVATAARETARDLRATAESLRRHWTAPAVAEIPAPPYPLWLLGHRASRTELAAQRARADEVAGGLQVLVVVLPGEGDLGATLESLAAQSSPWWSALVCGRVPSGGSDERVTAVSDADPGAAVAGRLADAGRAMTLLLRPGDRLAPDCVFEVALAVHRAPAADLVTWDDDVAVGRAHGDPRFRPAWSPELLLGDDYVGRAFALRASTILAAGGLGPLADPAAHWDLLLRAGLPAERVRRITRVLSSIPARTTVPDDAAVSTVQAHLDRSALHGRAVAGRHGGVRILWELPQWPKVTVVVPTRHNRDVLRSSLPSVAASDYPAFDVVVVDNGDRTPENEQWYAGLDLGIDLGVLWWDRPFNYSAVNNAAATRSDAEVLVFLNDDTEILDPSWLRELVGWAVQPAVGVVGLQLLDPTGLIQHTGVVIGMSGFADHVFAGMERGSTGMYGPSDRIRNVLAVTGACCAVRREVFDAVGGFDERFRLTGSDVALGLAAVLAGRRNVCSPHAPVRHLESATRGTTVPAEDYFASYWRYNPWLFGGDPYWNPNMSLRSRRPRLRARTEPPPAEWVGRVIGRDLTAYRQRSDADESRRLAAMCQVRDADVAAIRDTHAENRDRFPVRTVNWFVPDIDSPFYGGINTALRTADLLAREHGVENRFVVWGQPPDHFVRSALAAAFPRLADSPIAFYDESMDLGRVPAADAGIATLWTTAYALAHAPGIRRKFYLVQDYEPMFYPAGTQYALAEESYRLGLYGICNTANLRRVYEEEYGGRAMSFTPAVDPAVFSADGRPARRDGDPVTVFVYARPGHWRNCWELASAALTELKRRLGDRVHIVTAGARAVGGDDGGAMEHLGLLDYRATGDLYRRSDVGLALTVSRHPSYLPLELMASGVPVVAFDNPWGHWLLRDGENSLLARRTVDSLADQLERLCTDAELRERLGVQGLADVMAGHADWDRALGGVYDWLCDPEGDRP
ncbi:rhamnosyltransferase WsaF family glycosyltransferase [Blastococcus deserti]|uniref:Glycosyltransferase n=1 Tax=Blastococcus deserti TaxID=2259033 RepID=A0ABW4X5N6_9ACTN